MCANLPLRNRIAYELHILQVKIIKKYCACEQKQLADQHVIIVL